MFSANEYNIRQDEKGNVVIETYDEEPVNDYMELVATRGLLEIKDSETKEVLFNNRDIKSILTTVDSDRNNTSSNVCLIFELNKEAQEKLENIKNEYTYTAKENNESSDAENSNEESSEPEKKKFLITFDEENLVTAQFGDSIKEGYMQMISGNRIQVPLHTATNNQNTLNRYYNEAILVERLVSIGDLPIEYTISNVNILSPAIRPEIVHIIGIIVAVAVLLMVAFLIIRYNAKGVWGGISFIGFIAAYMLVMRYTNSLLTINSIVAMAIVIVFNYLFIISLIRKES